MNRASGRYLAQPGGFSAFVPDPLPRGLDLSPGQQTLLSRADRALGRLEGTVAIVPDADRFISMFVLREAVLSSQIEGTNASITDVLEFEALMQRRSESMDVQEVVNYVAATNRGLDLLGTLPLSQRLIKDVHAVLMKDVRGGEASKTPGEFRSSQNWIGGASPASATFVPPPADEITRTFGELEKFMNDELMTLPPLVAAGLIHAQFETIHPFLDGNGRTGRLLITFWLIDRKVLTKPILYPSLYLKREQDEYVRRLQGTRSRANWGDWLTFFLDAVCAAAEEAAQVALSIVGLQRQHRDFVATNFGKRAPNALRLLEHLYNQPIVTRNLVMEMLGLSQPTVWALLNEFQDKGLLRETTGGERNRRYSYDSYLQLFPGINERS